MQARDCEKVLLYNICNFKDEWTGDSAQWVDNCIDSTAPSMTFMNKKIADSIAD